MRDPLDAISEVDLYDWTDEDYEPPVEDDTNEGSGPRSESGEGEPA